MLRRVDELKSFRLAAVRWDAIALREGDLLLGPGRLVLPRLRSLLSRLGFHHCGWKLVNLAWRVPTTTPHFKALGVL